MRGREFIALVGGAAAWPLAARAQQAALPVIGFLSSGSPNPYAHLLTAFRRGLNETDYVEHRNVGIEYRWAEGQADRLPALANELVTRPRDRRNRRQCAGAGSQGGDQHDSDAPRS